MTPRKALIIGAGPAGLTAAYELATRSDVAPVVLEQTDAMGGISRTINHRGNRIDIGGHRFFSKSDRVMAWWLDMLPLQALPPGTTPITYHNRTRDLDVAGEGPEPTATDAVMLLRERQSRIYFLRKFFPYPIKLDPDTLGKLGPVRTVRIGLSYVRSVLFPIRPETNLEAFFINRFGRELYLTFFKSYTEKVWGRACRDISAEWGAQRIKGLSVTKAITHFVGKLLGRGAAGKGVETSLIEQFLYPKHGPGQVWEEAARRVQGHGGEVHTGWQVVRLTHAEGRVTSVTARHAATGEARTWAPDHVFSTMPVRELVQALDPPAPPEVKAVSDALEYRDFLTVGLLVDRLAVTEPGPDGPRPIRDNWIYIQEPDVQLGRLQIFNNWSPWMVADPNTVWLGLEYFANEGDALWAMDEAALMALGEQELVKIGLIAPDSVRDACVIRQPKAYPGYFGAYDRFATVRAYLDGFTNLWLVGRNGMHRYNNQDHSMLTAMTAVDQIMAGVRDPEAIWAINTEEEYHEEK
jgi:protoporphyrinogen oxidase